MVVSALDTQTGKRIAIKKCANLFVDPVDARKIGREIRIMSQLNHPNIIKVIDVLPPPHADFDDVYMVRSRLYHHFFVFIFFFLRYHNGAGD